jgi:hypothetical protein
MKELKFLDNSIIEGSYHEKKTTGEHQIEFNASSLSSRIYLYTLEAGDFKTSHKMLLMR